MKVKIERPIICTSQPKMPSVLHSFATLHLRDHNQTVSSITGSFILDSLLISFTSSLFVIVSHGGEMLSMVAASFLFSVISSTNFAATKYVKCITFYSPKHFPSRKTRHWSSNVKTLIRELFCHAGMSAHRVLSQQLFDGFENWISLMFIVLR